MANASEILRALPNTFIPLFVAVDVFWVLPVFLSMTLNLTVQARRRVVRQSTATAFAVSLIFTAVGKWTFGILGITVDDFKVPGGVLLLVLAIMDLARTSVRDYSGDAETIGVVPIGVPLIVGPAVLTTIIVLVDQHGAAPTVIALVLNLCVVWGTLSFARRAMGFLGTGGVVALSKIMSILLASIAVMMIRLGMEGILGR